MQRKIVGLLLLAFALLLLTLFYSNLPPPGVERKGGVILFGMNLNDLVSLLGGVVSLASGIVTLATARRKGR